MIDLVIFWVGTVIIFYLPGVFIIRKSSLKLNFLEDYFLSNVIGLLLFTLIALPFSWLKIEFFIPLIILTIDFIVVKRGLINNISIEKKDYIPLIIILLFAAIFTIPSIVSGYYGNNLYVVGVNNIDGWWYLALINELKNNFPPQHPGYAGVMLQGYHFLWFFNLAKLSSYLNINELTLLFRLSPIFISILWGIGIYTLIYRICINRLTAVLAVFLSMFGGSFVFISYLSGHKELNLDSGYGILQPPLSLLNPTFAISIVIIIAFLFLTREYIYQNVKNVVPFLVLIVGLLSLFKVYAGIILIAGYLFIVILDIIKKKYGSLFGLFGVAALFFGSYWPFTDRGAHFIFYPLWAPHSVLRDNMPWYGYDEKVYTYTQQRVLRGIIETELYGLKIFLLGNLGSRLVGLIIVFLLLIKNKLRLTRFSLLIIFLTIISIIMPLFFIQTGKVFETIQFAWYFLFFMSLVAAIGFGYLLENIKNKIAAFFIILLIVTITLPSAVYDLKNYLLADNNQIDGNTLSWANYISNTGDYNDTILFLPDKNINNDLKSLQKWYRTTSPRFIALAKKNSYLTYEYFDFKETNVDERLNFISNILENEKKEQKNEEIVKGLKNRKIKYIYSSYPMKLSEKSDNINIIYAEGGIYIYAIK